MRIQLRKFRPIRKEEIIKKRFASKKNIKTGLVDILQTLMLTKKRQGVLKKEEKRDDPNRGQISELVSPEKFFNSKIREKKKNPELANWRIGEHRKIL